MKTPKFLPPASPADLLTYIIDHHEYPTTLIVCSPQPAFLASLIQDVEKQIDEGTSSTGDQQEPDADGAGSHGHATAGDGAEGSHRLLASPLYQIAIARHIRVIYAPTVTHLRALLSVFSEEDSRVKSPPSKAQTDRNKKPHLIVYGFLQTHRDTSEWTAQGLSNTTSALVETARRLSWRALMVEPREDELTRPSEDMLRETVPILSGSTRRLGLHSEEGAWSGRTVEVGEVLGRWFTFPQGQWDGHRRGSNGD